MSSLFEQLYPIESQQMQTCLCCKKVALYRGWESLCNRACYYDMCDLLYLYDRDGGVPDERLVSYFTKYPEPAHWFSTDKIMAYIKSKGQ